MNIKILFHQHGHRLCASLLRKAGDPQLAADLTQECFARLLEQPDHRPPANPAAWLQLTAHRLLIDHMRQQARRKTDPLPGTELEALEQPGANVEEQVALQQRIEHLQACLTCLPPLTRQIFVLNRIEGMTHAEVARRLGISDSSVQKHLARALAHVMRQPFP